MPDLHEETASEATCSQPSARNNSMATLEPTAELSIPSLQDSTPLDLRIYLPRQPTVTDTATDRTVDKATVHSKPKFAIIAHPYAPLGGTYDDPVVCELGETLCKQGYVTCTFNFRGAHGSKGRTSWSGQAEVKDYMSMAAFMAAYMSFANPTRPSDSTEPIETILAGYSYGSMITSMLPCLSTLQEYTTTPYGAEIVRRARLTARDFSNALRGLDDHAADGGTAGFTVPELRTRVLLVAPLLPPVTSVLALTFPPSLPLFGSGSWSGSVSSCNTNPEPKLLDSCPVLAVYGSQDVFAAAKRLGTWCAGMQKSNPRFQSSCVDGAGHFWVEDGVIETLLQRVERWIATPGPE